MRVGGHVSMPSRGHVSWVRHAMSERGKGEKGKRGEGGRAGECTSDTLSVCISIAALQHHMHVSVCVTSLSRCGYREAVSAHGQCTGLP